MRLLLVKGHRELRVFLAQRADRLRRQPARGGRKGGDGDLAGDLGVVGFELGLGFLEERQHAVRARDERVGGIGQPDAAAMALEQRLAGFGLQFRELLRHRRRGDVERLGGGDDRAVGGHGVQGAQAIEVQHTSNSKLNHQELFTCPK